MWPKQLSNNPNDLSNQEATQNQGKTIAPKSQRNDGNNYIVRNWKEATPPAWTGENSANECENQHPTNIPDITAHTIPNVNAGELTQV